MSNGARSSDKKAAAAVAPRLVDASHVWESARPASKPGNPDHAANISSASRVWTRYTDGRMKQFGSR